MALRTVGVRLTADVSQYVSNMARASQSTKGFAQGLDKQAATGKLDAIADRAGVAGIALGGAAAYAVKQFADFDKQMSAVKAATHASSGEMDKLRGAAMQAGKDTQFSAIEAAKGVEELAKAGVSTADILGGGLKGALDLAAAGQIDVGEAAETAASALTQFKLQGKDVPHVADLLSAAAGKAQGSVADMGAALNQAGLIAAQTGLSIEDTTGTLAAFANAGLIGSDAGTSFKTMLQALQAPSGKTKELMDELGISAYDAQGNFIGITALAGQLKTQLGTLTPELRANALAQIFGSDATRAASILYEQGSAGIQTWIDKTNDAGYAAETAAIKTDNLAGDIERLKGSLDTLLIQGGGGANGGLRLLAQSAEALVDQFGELPPQIGQTVTVLAGLGGATLIAGAGWVKMRRSTAETLAELRQMGPVGARTATGLSRVTSAAGKAAGAFVALQVASAAVGAAQDDLNPQVDALATGLADFGNSGRLAGETARLLGNDLGDLETGFKFLADDDNSRRKAVRELQGGLEGLVPGLEGTNTSLTRTKERITAMDSALAQLVQSGQAGQARAAFDRLGSTLAVNGVSMEEFRKQFPAYAAAVEVAGSASTKTAGSIGTVGETAEEAQKKVEELSKAFDDLFGAQMSIDRANLKYQEGVGDLTKELSRGAATLSLNTAEGRRNRAAVLDQIDTINDLRDSRVQQGATLDEANRKYVKDIDGLRRSMRQAGFTAKAVDELTGSYRALPGKISTPISQPGMPKAQSLAKGYRQQLDEISSHITTKFTVDNYGDVYGKLKRLLVQQQALSKGISISAAASAFGKQEAKAYHSGGWTGPGGKYDPAGTVHADEFVIKKESRRRIEQTNPGLLDELNATGQMRGYAGGGLVAPFNVNAGMTKVLTLAQALSKVSPSFSRDWPSSPMAQRGDSGIWREVIRLIKSGPKSGSFGNSYRPGDPKWHGSGRAVDWMGFNQDALASFLAAKKPLELIHRTRTRDYAYTRGRNKGSFNNALMQAHRNHIHIAMEQGGTIREPIYGVGLSGRSYSFGEGYKQETVTPGAWSTSGGGGGGQQVSVTLAFSGPVGSQYELETWLTGAVDKLRKRGRI